MDQVAARRAVPARLAIVPIAYFAATAIAVAASRFGGGVACIWIAGAVLLASLMAVPGRLWGWLALACYVAGMVATGWLGIGWRGAPPLAAITVAEPLVAAWLLRRWRIRRSTLDSIGNLTLFGVAAGVVAPLVTGLPGAVWVSYLTGTPFAANLLRWFVAHGLGALTFAPVFALVANGEALRWLRGARWGEAMEAAALLLLVAMTSAFVFAQSSLPVLFLPVLPLMILTFRKGPLGAGAAIVLIAMIGGGFTLVGRGPVALLHASGAAHIQFFQFYLLVTVMTVLPVAADLSRRAVLFERLRDSEARFRLLTEHSSDIVLNLDVDGTIRYASPSIARLGGYDPERVIGTRSSALILAEDRSRVRAVHLSALAEPDRTFVVEFRGLAEDGAHRWFETHTRAIPDGEGGVVGAVSAIREISERKRAEVELAHAAATDPLTGVANRRAFDARLDALVADAKGGCVALFDLDHFKRVNDTFGHGVGDEVLRSFARAAGAHVRAGDMLARIGGEEFAVLFPGIAVPVAAAVCERIRLAVAASRSGTSDWPAKVTVSVGIAAIAPDAAAERILRNADAALYRAKAEGRNRAALAA